ncbi:hypothetical protein [Shimia sp. Alg240-R146]|uniref:hypothetical protein n=1 Tax=Shimia sp. Alg240-R146 TaxID=2993449 RepID=UPI0022E91A18|nr:hypothetical protein [Shimia sp. Alg240-R146]
MGERNSVLKADWPSNDRPYEIAFGEGVEQRFQIKFAVAILKAKSRVLPILGIELAGWDVIAVATTPQELVRLALKDTPYSESALKRLATETCSRVNTGNSIYALAVHGLILVCKSPGASVGREITQSKLEDLAAHEFMHLVQFQLAGSASSNDRPDQASAERGPIWLLEGSAQAFANAVAFDRPAWTGRLAAMRKFPDGLPDLNELEHREMRSRAPIPVYFGGMIGAVDPVDKSGFPAIAKFYEILGRRGGWQRAFEEAFGISVDTYYTLFAEMERVNTQGAPLSGWLLRD